MAVNSSTVAANDTITAAERNNLRLDVLEQAGEYRASTGSANAYVVADDAQLGSLVEAQTVVFKANFANTSTATLNFGGFGAKTIKKNGSDNLVAGDIESGQVVVCKYDGTSMQMLSGIANDAPKNEDFVAGETLVAGNVLSRADIANAESAPTLADDVRVDENFPDTNYQGGTPLILREVGTNDDNWIFLKFTGLPSLGSAEQITTFNLNLQVTSTSSAGKIEAYAVSDAFAMATVTWNNKPAISAAIGELDGLTTGAKTIPCSVPTIALTNDIIDNGICIKTTNINTVNIDSINTGGGTPITISSLKSSDTKADTLYKADGNFEASANAYMGFTSQAVVSGQVVPLKINGIDDSQAGMTPEGSQYMSDTAGDVSDSAGTFSKVVGKACSATRILISPPI